MDGIEWWALAAVPVVGFAAWMVLRRRHRSEPVQVEVARLMADMVPGAMISADRRLNSMLRLLQIGHPHTMTAEYAMMAYDLVENVTPGQERRYERLYPGMLDRLRAAARLYLPA